MQSIRLGKSGLTVGRVGFGAIPIQRLSETEAVRVLQGCLDLGVNFIDTANGYGVSEERVGKAIAGRRSGLVIATKTDSRTAAESAEHLQLSLERLNIDCIDLYQFHNVATAPEYETILAPGGAMETFRKALANGKIKHIGFTTHSEELAKKAVLSGLFETLQYPFNFIGNEAANGLIQLCRQHEVGFIAMKPMGGGLLEKASLAFKYIFAFDNVLPDPGIEKVEEMEEILSVLEGDLTLSPEEVRQMEQIREELGKSFCHRCNYCQPCSNDLQISVIMTIKSIQKRFPPEVAFTGWAGEAMEAASRCSECGDCEARCPFGLPIRETIKANLKWWEVQRTEQPAPAADVT